VLRWNGERKVPRSDDAVDATRLPDGDEALARIVAGDGRSFKACCIFGRHAEHLGSDIDLSERLGMVRLALLHAKKPAEIFAAGLNDIANLVTELAALKHRQGRERRLRSAGRLDGTGDIFARSAWHASDLLAGCGAEDRNALCR